MPTEEWLDEMDDPPAEESCIACGAWPSTPGTLRLRWCPECQHREQFIAWGKAHGWPELACLPYTITAGQKHWMLAVAVGNDDMIYHALLFMEYLEKEKEEQAA